MKLFPLFRSHEDRVFRSVYDVSDHTASVAFYARMSAHFKGEMDKTDPRASPEAARRYAHVFESFADSETRAQRARQKLVDAEAKLEALHAQNEC